MFTGECACQDADGVPNGFYGRDCSLVGCKNNCSNVPGEEPVGECIQDYPFAYCRCFEELRRGGDDCSKKFCLNDCAGNGVCNDEGMCDCDDTWYGTDCSVQVFELMEGALWQRLGLVSLLLISVIYF